MNYKAKIIKIVLNKMPVKPILWGANKKLKGIAKLTDFSVNIDDSRLYVQVILAGEEEVLDVLLEKFTIINVDGGCRLAIQQVKSNRIWLDTVLNKAILGREFPVPEAQAELVQQLFESKNVEQDEGKESAD